MNKKRTLLAGYFLIFLTLCFFAGITIFSYSLLANQNNVVIAIIILLLIALTSLVFVVIDFFRRKYTIDKPLDDILKATRRMTNGDFDISLVPNHIFSNYNAFDLIKDDLNRLALELSKNEALNNNFISNVSHEIKTPLANIKNYAKALENTSIDDKTRDKYLLALQNSCKKLSNLINNVLKLNKLENQELVPEFKLFNLTESVTNQIIQYETLIDNKSIELECELEEDIFIKNEESYLEIIWNNLISNAIKFTDINGRILIKLEKKSDLVVFTITDSGCGIDVETGKHIFDKFYQGDTSHSKEGNGLGLALVKRVIDLLGGEISVISEVNKGTTFVVTLKGEVSNG